MAKGSESSGSASPASEQDGGVEAQGLGGGADGGARPMLDLDFVRGLIEAVDGSGIDSLEITRAGTRVKISKTPPSAATGPGYFAVPQSAPGPAPAPQAASADAGGGAPAAGAEAAEASSSESGGESSKADGLVDVTSPMVGTFYRAPAPEAPPYVEVGTRVGKGQTLCILEAMKLMNELESEAEGVIREILVDNAEPVEYGQVLFRIDPNG